MSESHPGYNTLSQLERILPERKPVSVENGVLLKEDAVGSILVCFDVVSSVTMPIEQVKFELSFRDVFEAPIGKPMKIKYKKLRLSSGEGFTVREPIKFTNAFYYSVAVTDVIFTDGSVWRASFDEERENPLTKQV